MKMFSRFWKRITSYAERHCAALEEAPSQVNSVYSFSDSVTEFLNHPTNAVLYDIVAETLAKELSALVESSEAEYTCSKPCFAMDIGSGPGIMLARVCKLLQPGLWRWTILEPSKGLLEANQLRLKRLGLNTEALQETLQDFVTKEDPEEHNERYRVGIMTYCLSAIPASERKKVLEKLALKVSTILVVEFDCDVPGMACTSGDRLFADERVKSIVDKYARGYPSYIKDDCILEEFLMPALFGYFDESSTRVTHEQSMSEWLQEFEELQRYRVSEVTSGIGSFW